MSHLQAFLERLQSIPRPTAAIQAYIDGVAALVALNAEDRLARGWYRRWVERADINQKRWEHLSATEQTIIREVTE